MTDADTERQKKTAKTRPNKLVVITLVITTVIAVVGLGLSILNYYDAQLRSEIQVTAGKQTRLYVAFDQEDSTKAQPCIMMTMMYTNQGGKPGTVFDTKLNVRWLCGERMVLEREFEALREVENFLEAEGHFPQHAVAPVVVLGKSNEVRKYVFTPYESIRQDQIPKSFDLNIQVHTQTMNEWLPKARYRLDNVTDVWQDLASDTTFKAEVLNIRQIQ